LLIIVKTIILLNLLLIIQLLIKDIIICIKGALLLKDYTYIYINTTLVYCACHVIPYKEVVEEPAFFNILKQLALLLEDNKQ
jgi:hypothetical protein